MPRIETILRVDPKTRRRVITHFGKQVVFQEIAHGRFVAEVPDVGHARALLAVPGYVEFTDELRPNLVAVVPSLDEQTRAAQARLNGFQSQTDNVGLQLAAQTQAARDAAATPVGKQSEEPIVATVPVDFEAQLQAIRDLLAQEQARTAELMRRLASEGAADRELAALPQDPTRRDVSADQAALDKVAPDSATSSNSDAMQHALEDPSPEDKNAAEALLGGTARQIRNQLDKGEASRVVLALALQMEKQASNPRVGVVESLTQTLEKLAPVLPAA